MTDLPFVVEEVSWNDHENSDPITDVAAGIAAYKNYHGAPPEKLVISPRLFNALLDHPLILESLKITEPGTRLTPALLAQIFDVADVIVV